MGSVSAWADGADGAVDGGAGGAPAVGGGTRDGTGEGDSNGALASNREELVSGIDYFDAAVFDAMAMGLFAPGGRIGRATMAGLQRIRVAFGPGWSRNDDRRDHAGRTDLSPWGS